MRATHDAETGSETIEKNGVVMLSNAVLESGEEKKSDVPVDSSETTKYALVNK